MESEGSLQYSQEPHTYPSRVSDVSTSVLLTNILLQ
jgi:hypothetical protein